MKLNIKHLFGALLLLSTMAAFSACSGSDDMVDTAAEVSGLKIGLAIGDASVASRAESRAASDNSLKEDVINDLNVFFYKADGTIAKHYHLSSNLASGQQSLLQSGSAWKTDLVPGTAYTVYAIANYGSMSDLAESALQQTITDAEINKPYPAKSDKQFVMDGKSTWTSVDGANVNVPVTLKRAAAKILVKVAFEKNFQDKIAMNGDWKWNLLNYGTKAALLDGTVLEDKGVTSETAFGHSVTPSAKTDTTKIVTYTYQNIWTDPTGQTMVEVNMPLTYNNVSYPTNKYKFPITLLKQTDRNYIYEVDATINALGNTNEPYESYLKYHVQPWLTNDIYITTATSKYLIVSPDDITLTNETTYSDIHFYSSSAASVVVTKAYYYNANGVEVDLNNKNTTPRLNKITATMTGSTSGTISVTSPVPTNLGPRYIVLTVTNKDGLSHTITVTQYPLEYVTSITGSYSYKDDGNGNQVLNYYDGTNRVNGSNNSWSDFMFQSKYYDGTYIYFPDDWDKDYWNYTSSQSNNHMYVVRITTTSSTYTVDRPLITDGVTDGSAANNNVVSPAFMIASQLGTVYQASWVNASTHCKNYVEVHKNADGTETKYDDWRLPTLAELSIITKYQTAGKDVMTTVLAGPYYWSAYNVDGVNGYFGTGKEGSTYGPYPGTLTEEMTSCYIRCIRDMKPSELINK